MSRVEKIESQISELSAAELAAFRDWFAEFDANAWDRQFEADVKAGELDSLAEKVLNDHAAGRQGNLDPPRVRGRKPAELLPAQTQSPRSVASFQEGREVLVGSCGPALPGGRC